MFVTCHITFGQPSNFVGASLEVTRTIRNNNLYFTWGCSILLLKKGKGPRDRIPFFFNDSGIFKKCFSWFFYLGVPKGTGFFSCFFFHSSSSTWLALALASRLPPFDRETLKNYSCSADPGLLNESKGSCFPLSCLCSYQNKWSKHTFFNNNINI